MKLFACTTCGVVRLVIDGPPPAVCGVAYEHLLGAAAGCSGKLALIGLSTAENEPVHLSTPPNV